MSWVLALPLVIAFASAIASFLLRRTAIGRWISIAGSLALLASAIALMAAVLDDGIVAGQMGNWPAPFGITLVADALAAVMVLITAITGLAVVVYAVGEVSPNSERLGFHGLFHTLIGGVCGAFLTGDLFNLYVWFEVMLIASFGLLVLEGTRAQLDAGIKYVALNLVATLVFLIGIGMLYALTGTLNLADLGRVVPAHENQPLMTVVAMLFMVGFGIKAALFPLFFWLPASYHTPSFAVSAVFAGLLTKVGVYALMRLFTLVFTSDIGLTHSILAWSAALTMVTGVLGAAAQSDFRKILSFHIISQIGYMVMGLALLTPLALLGAVYYLVHHIIVKTNLFLVAGVAHQIGGDTVLARIGGLYRAAPLLAVLFLIPAFSLAGFPPLSGFWAKYLLLVAALEIEAWLIAAVMLVVGLLTVYSMTKIWIAAFWKDHPAGIEPGLERCPTATRRLLLLPIVGLATLTVVIGIMPEPFVSVARLAAEQLLAPDLYITRVLGAAP